MAFCCSSWNWLNSASLEILEREYVINVPISCSSMSVYRYFTISKLYWDRFRDRVRVRVHALHTGAVITSSESDAPINSKLQHPSPPDNPRVFDCLPCPGVENLNLTWVEWEIWSGGEKSFQRNTRVLMKAFKGKESAFVSEWHRNKIFTF